MNVRAGCDGDALAVRLDLSSLPLEVTTGRIGFDTKVRGIIHFVR